MTQAYWQGYVSEDFEIAMPSNALSHPQCFSRPLKIYIQFFHINGVITKPFFFSFLLLILQSDMQRGVHGRLMDNSTSVREAAVELLGRFVLSRPQLTEQYYDMLIERILVRFHHTSLEIFVRLCHKQNFIYMFEEKYLLLNSPICFLKLNLENNFAGKSKVSCGVI